MNNDNERHQEAEDYTKEEVRLRDYFLKQAYPQPDVQEELKAFRRRQQPRRKSRAVLIAASFLSGAAAVLLTLFILHSQNLISFGAPQNEPLVAFEANANNADEVTLQQAGATAVAVDGSSASKLAQMGAQLNAKDKRLIYDTQNATKIAMQTLSTPRRKTFKVVLSDGTEVWMNAESKLVYPNKFTGPQRVVQLHGEAYFKVAHNAKCPFIVRTDQLQTQVLGTEFNLRNYSRVDTHVTLLKGSVEVSNSSGSCRRRIKPGEDAQLTAGNTFRVKQVDTEEYSMWKDGYFYFDNVSLIEITQELGRWYNVGVVFNNRKDLDTKVFFVADRHGSVRDAIELLNSMKKVHLSFRGNQIVVD
jgi:ferric-dicitrate binding protein FerR (iron transport regulator)